MSTSHSMIRAIIQSIKDPAYVPRYNNARNQIRKYERDEIVEELVRYYLKGQGIDL